MSGCVGRGTPPCSLANSPLVAPAALKDHYVVEMSPAAHRAVRSAAISPLPGPQLFFL